MAGHAFRGWVYEVISAIGLFLALPGLFLFILVNNVIATENFGNTSNALAGPVIVFGSLFFWSAFLIWLVR